MLLLYVVGIPAAAEKLLQREKDNLDEDRVKILFAFMYKG